MKKREALEFMEKLMALCKEKGIWHDVTQSNKPKLGHIDIEISIKVDKD